MVNLGSVVREVSEVLAALVVVALVMLQLFMRALLCVVLLEGMDVESL